MTRYIYLGPILLTLDAGRTYDLANLEVGLRLFKWGFGLELKPILPFTLYLSIGKS